MRSELVVLSYVGTSCKKGARLAKKGHVLETKGYFL